MRLFSRCCDIVKLCHAFCPALWPERVADSGDVHLDILKRIWGWNSFGTNNKGHQISKYSSRTNWGAERVIEKGISSVKFALFIVLFVQFCCARSWAVDEARAKNYAQDPRGIVRVDVLGSESWPQRIAPVITPSKTQPPTTQPNQQKIPLAQMRTGFQILRYQ